MENNFNFKKFLAEGKMLRESIYSDVEEYLTGLYDQFASEDYEEGEEVSNLISREEFGDAEAYDDAEMFDKAYNEIEENGGSITIEGQPNITFTLKNQDIVMNFTTEGELNENEIEETSINEGTLDFSDEEIGMLRDGLDWLVEYQEGVAPNDYIAAVKRLAMKLESGMLQK
jgi:hypothetical protein